MDNGQNSNGFPPGMAPGTNPGMAGGGFVLDIPADPNWEPFETTDVLEKDGYYACKITREAARSDSAKSSGVFLTLEIVDEDARGKRLSKFMMDPRTAKSNVWFVWRNLFMSITGNKAQAQAAIRYTPGMLTGQYVFVKTEPYQDGETLRTSVQTFVTKDEWENATKENRHRWVTKPKAASALPGGLPGGFPGGGSGFPGLPGAPAAGTAPQASMPAPQPMAAPAPAVTAPMAPPPVMQPAAAPSPFTSPGFGGFAAPPPVMQAAPPVAPAAPQFAAPVAPQPAGAPAMLGAFPPGTVKQ